MATCQNRNRQEIMTMKIRFCEHNRGKGETYRQLKQEFPHISIKVKSCIKKCSSCDDRPMATIDKEKVTARDGKALYQKLKQRIEENNA